MKRTQLQLVEEALQDGDWWTLAGLRQFVADTLPCSEAGISARIRDLRAQGLTIEKQRVFKRSNQWKYRLLKNGQGEMF